MKANSSFKRSSVSLTERGLGCEEEEAEEGAERAVAPADVGCKQRGHRKTWEGARYKTIQIRAHNYR